MGREIGSVERRDVDCFVLSPSLVERVVEGSGEGRGIAD
jgi:hypothetical protein